MAAYKYYGKVHSKQMTYGVGTVHTTTVEDVQKPHPMLNKYAH